MTLSVLICLYIATFLHGQAIAVGFPPCVMCDVSNHNWNLHLEKLVGENARDAEVLSYKGLSEFPLLAL